MSASSQHPLENQKKERESERDRGLKRGGGGWVGDGDIRRQNICEFLRVCDREKGNEGEKVIEMGEKREKITRIHPVPLCGEFIRLKE